MKRYRNVELPPEVRAGEPVTADDHNKLIRAHRAILRKIDAITVRSGAEVGVKNSDGSGIILFLKRRAGTGGTSKRPVPWEPVFFQEGTPEAPVYKCRFNLGTMNNVPATNWNDAFTLGMAADAYHFVVVTVTSSSGQVTGLTLSVDTTAPATDDIAKGTPPTSHKIVLGAIGRTSAKMIVTTNLSMTAAVVFLESKPAPAIGAEPYDRWWRWNHTTI